MNKYFTVIVTFLNEGDEVGLTCKSVRETCGDKVDIIVINDNSDDGYDYFNSLKQYNIRYYKNDERKGCTVCRHMAVSYCETPYFIILDAHCRFYTHDWLNKAIAIMERNDNSIYCCSVQYFYNEEDHKDNKNIIAYGAYFKFTKEAPLGAAWNVKNLAKGDDDTFVIPCLMGANYICSKRWWNHINGLEGITMWGRDEEFLSLKSYLAGGDVKCITNILTAHKGRINNERPYVCYSTEVYHNEIAIAYIVLPYFFEKIVQALRECYKDYEYYFNKTLDTFINNRGYYEKLKDEFYKIKIVNIDTFVETINNPFKELYTK